MVNEETKKAVDLKIAENSFELILRILGNELIGLKMTVDDFKMKWLVLGVVMICALGWAASAFGPNLIGMFESS